MRQYRPGRNPIAREKYVGYDIAPDGSGQCEIGVLAQVEYSDRIQISAGDLDF